MRGRERSILIDSQGTPVATVLQLRAQHVTDVAGLSAASLSHSRVSGLASMLDVIQAQLRQLCAETTAETAQSVLPTVDAARDRVEALRAAKLAQVRTSVPALGPRQLRAAALSGSVMS